MRSNTPGGQGPSAAGEALAPEQLLAQPTLWRRWVMLALVAVVAAPVTPLWLLFAWLVAYGAVMVGERVVIARYGYIAGDFAGLAVTFSLSSLHAAAAYHLITVDDGGVRLFAVALIGFSAVSILLRFYAAPRMFMTAMTPHVAVLGWVCWGIFARHMAAGEYFRALAPVAVVATYAVLLLPARRRLADAWSRLADAKLAAEAASRAKSQFLATMSHEIRTPLNGILGMAQVMQRDELTPAQKERLRVIRRSGEGLLGLLNDALDFSQIEAGRLTLETAEFDMEHQTRGAVATLMPLAASKGLTFEYSIDQAAKGRFRGDPTRLRQILYNLVSNAVKFTESGRIGVCVSYDGRQLRVEVADSGIGIPAGQLSAVFERFVQGDPSTTRRHAGVGLGLAICRSLAELMGGSIAVSSVEGRGSIFTVALPMVRLAGPAPIEVPPAALALEQNPPEPIRILAAEDNAVNQLVLKTLLSQAGLEATVVENGAEAVAAWRSGSWDVILMDIQMPVMDGVTATRAIRAAEVAEARRRTPIIAVTANAMSHQVTDYLAAGIDDVAPKPLDAARLFQAIERALVDCEGGSEAAAA